MMNKKIMIMTVVLVAGAAAVLFLDKSKERKGDPRLGQPIVEGVAIVGVDEIEIAKGEAKVKLVLDGEQIWRLDEKNGFPADASKITVLLDDLTKIGVQVLATTSPDAMNEFGFDAATKVILSSGGKEVLTANLANKRDKGGQYISFGGEYKVYLIGQSLNALPDPSAWEIKTLINVKPEQIKTVEFAPLPTSGRKSVVLTREKKEDPIAPQQIPDGSKAAASIRSHESIMSAMSFSSRIDPGNEEYKSAMATPTTVTVTLFDGRVYTVKVGSVGDTNKKYFMHVTGVQAESTGPSEVKELAVLNDLMNRFAFEVPAYVGAKFEKGYDDMLDKKGS